MMRVLLAGLLSVAALVSNGQGADEAPAKGPFVVLVGVGNFEDKSIEARPTADADARAFGKLFSDKAYFSAGKDRVVVLTSKPEAKDGERLASRENIVKAIHEAMTLTGKDDTVILGLFGRGASSGDNTVFFTPETVFKERNKTALLGSELATELKLGRDRKLALLLDISFKGFDAGKETLAEPNLRDILTGVFGNDENREGPAPPDRVVMLSATPSHVPLTKGDNSLFAASVLEALKGTADVEGGEPDGLVTVDELVKFIEKNISEEARKIGKTPIEKESVPFIIGGETSHFPLTLNPKVTPKVESRIKAISGLANEGKLKKEVAEEGVVLLGRMPKLKALQELRKNYEALAEGTLTPEKFAIERGRIKESMKISGEALDKYTRLTMKAIDTVRPKYVKEFSVGEWGAMAVKGLYRRLELPVPTDILEQLKEPKALTRTKVDALLRDARERLGKREDLDDNKDVDLSLLMMLAELKDPYTTYYDKELIKKIESGLKGEFSGVGIQIRRDLVRDGLLVVSPIKGSPAYLAGIQAGDLIVEIKRDRNPTGDPLTSEEAKVISTKGMKTEQALDIILGKPGVPVTLVVEREGQKEPKEFTIRRGRVSVETVLGVKRDEKDDWSFVIDEENKIGYICLTQFAPTTARDLYQAIESLKKRGLKGLVLDLRFNPGGLLTQAVAVSDLFLEDGVVVSVKYRHKEPEVWGDRGIAAYTNFPMAVLVNGSSASAAEIVSAALQDYNRAIVVGERSYGKGSVQNIEDFTPTGGQIKMTTARYFPPLNRNIDKLSTSGKDTEEWGVKPDKDFEVKLSREEQQDLAEFFRNREIIAPKAAPKKDEKPFKDKQLEKALEYLKSQTRAANDKPGKKDGN
jgi:carboxyl-terminal processing protease